MIAASDTAKNRGVLFAHVYIDSVIAQLKESDGSAFLETVKDWFAKADRSSLERYVSSFVGPVLDVQGFVRGDLKCNVIGLFEDRNLTKMLSLCYVVDSTESLDQTVKGKNYSVCLIKKLKKAGLRWGILTNGNQWRIYYVNEKAPFESFFQLNLVQLIKNKDIPEASLFTLFFDIKSFVMQDYNCLLDSYRKQSEEATKGIEEHLQGKMEDILGKMCLGFIKSEGRDFYNEEEKRAIFTNSIYLLYRILFILYAEARGLLPLQKPEYYRRSMKTLIEQVKDSKTNNAENGDGHHVWNILLELFNWVNQGNQSLGIRPYNGGLFDDNEKPYLSKHSINDAFMSEALFSLGYREEKGNFVPINYSDLSVRHLGGLYEGILEYRLFIAPERMVRRVVGNVLKFIPETVAGKITRNDVIVEKGGIYFSESNQERKITGSYYTPEDVVNYIVKNSLGAFLEEVDCDLKAMIKKHLTAYDIAVDQEEKHLIEKFIDKQILSFIDDRVLKIKVLDPAMGSGHFLVNSSYYLSNYIVESLHITTWENHSIETDPLFWRRRVVEKCMFGVDLNELATELAKLSLWFITSDNQRPLTFLDHHLRTGNSLLGTELDRIESLPFKKNEVEPKQSQISNYFATYKQKVVPYILSLQNDMEESSEVIEDVDRKKQKLKEWEKSKSNLKILADTWLSTLFNNHISNDEFQLLIAKIVEGSSIDTNALTLYRERRHFIHWWLEFPEIIFRASNPDECGFDIVLGNPPYGNLMTIEEKSAMINFETSFLNEVAGNFVERALKAVRKGGFVGFVLANSIAINANTSIIRSLIRRNMSLSRMAFFGTRPARIFPDAEIRVMMFFGKKDKPDIPGAIFTTEAVKFTQAQRHLVLENLSFENSDELTLGKNRIGDEFEDNSLPKVGNPIIRSILLKLKDNSQLTLGDRINKKGFEHKMDFRKTGGYWLNALERMPYSSTKIESIAFESMVERDFALLLINSSLFYLYWSTYGNLRDLPLALLRKFPFPPIDKLEKIAVQIQNIKQNVSTCLLKSFMPNRGRVGEFKTALCKEMLDLSDDLLAGLYGLDNQELNYVKTYDGHIRKRGAPFDEEE